ncbi:MAG: VapC toxin family PIN domain ribonuclease [Rhodocyclaceae bacterium]|nr:VapC toxin family PIN domain ribonuclease [Rhodocyclaceae bacterium]
MRSLLDVNVLIALIDPDHVSHAAATRWWLQHREAGWASCPLTQNGCVRIISQPGYPNSCAVITVVELLMKLCADPCHEFWPDDASLLDSGRFSHARVHGHRQITDLYLLGLAVGHGGRLVTFDDKIPLSAVHGAKRQHLLVF